MDDLEMIKRCAEKMGLEVYYTSFVGLNGYYFENDEPDIDKRKYDPIHDDAQAMALVKRFNICIDHGMHDHAAASIRVLNTIYCATAPNLNRAIVECVARLP